MEAHAVTTLTGERLSSINALPGREAQIPYAPNTKYMPSNYNMNIQTTGSLNERVQ